MTLLLCCSVLGPSVPKEKRWQDRSCSIGRREETSKIVSVVPDEFAKRSWYTGKRGIWTMYESELGELMMDSTTTTTPYVYIFSSHLELRITTNSELLYPRDSHGASDASTCCAELPFWGTGTDTVYGGNKCRDCRKSEAWKTGLCSVLDTI